jgi:hypothetical protein
MKYGTSIFVHVGYPKAASSTLQKHLFQKHPEINNFGRYPTANIGRDTSEIDTSARFLTDESLRDFYQELVVKSNEEYDPRRARVLFDKSISGELCSDKANLLSNESFLAVFFSYLNIAMKARRLQSIIPEAKIIIVIRNQLNLIASQYRDQPFDPRNFGQGKAVSLDRWIKLALRYDQDIGFMSSLRFDEIISLYGDYFGADCVNVLCMEELAQDPTSFAFYLSEFMDIDPQKSAEILKSKHENKAVSWRLNTYRKWKRQMPRLKRLERLLNDYARERFFHFLESGRSRNYCIQGSSLDTLRGFFGDSNRVVQDKCDLPLSTYGYPM